LSANSSMEKSPALVEKLAIGLDIDHSSNTD
jgi:hypothetical protein